MNQVIAREATSFIDARKRDILEGMSRIIANDLCGKIHIEIKDTP